MMESLLVVVQFSVQTVDAIIKYRPLEKSKQDILSLEVKSTMSQEIGGKSSLSQRTQADSRLREDTLCEWGLLIADPLLLRCLDFLIS